MKKIWIINQFAMPPQYEVRVRHNEFAKALRRAGYDVTVIGGSFLHNMDKNLIEGKKKVLFQQFEGLNMLFVKINSYHGNGLKRILSFILFHLRLILYRRQILENLQGKPDVVIYDNPAFPINAALAFQKRFRAKLIVEVRDLWPESIVAYNYASRRNPIIQLLYLLEKRMYTKADAIVFSMEGGREYIVNKKWDQANKGPIDLSKVHWVSNGLNLMLFNESAESHPYYDLDLDDNTFFKVVYVGSIGRANHLDLVLDAAKQLKDENLKFLIFGSGPELENLQSRLLHEKIANVVIKGAVDKKSVPSILGKSNLNFIIVKDSGLLKYGLSLNKSYEYLASGNPMLIVGRAGYSMIEMHSCGVHVQEVSSSSFANAVKEIMQLDRDRYDEMGKNAKKAALAYDFSILSEKLIEIIEGIQK